MTCLRRSNRSANASTKISGGLRSLPLTCEHCYPSVVAPGDSVVLLGDDSLGNSATPQVAGARRSQDPGLPTPPSSWGYCSSSSETNKTGGPPVEIETA